MKDAWIAACAAEFERLGCVAAVARDAAVAEFNIRCRDEPLDDSPELPADQWPDPAEAAMDAAHEWDNDEGP